MPVLYLWHQFPELSLQVHHELLRGAHIIVQWSEDCYTYVVYGLCVDQFCLLFSLAVVWSILLEPLLEALIPLVDQAES